MNSRKTSVVTGGGFKKLDLNSGINFSFISSAGNGACMRTSVDNGRMLTIANASFSGCVTMGNDLYECAVHFTATREGSITVGNPDDVSNPYSTKFDSCKTTDSTVKNQGPLERHCVRFIF